MAFGTPEDDDTPKYDPLAQLLARGADQQQAAPQVAQPVATDQPAQQQPQAQVPYYVAAPQTAASPQAQPQQAPSPSQASTQAPAAAMPPVPQAPTIDQAKYQGLQDQIAKYSQPTDRSKYKPSVLDRIGGGLVGFGEGFRGDVGGGIRDGSAITDRKYNAAESDRTANEQGAQQALDGYTKQIDFANKQYSTQLEGTRAQNEQSNADRTFSLTQQNTQFNQNRDTRNDDFEHNYKTDDLTQRSKHEADELTEQGKRDAESARHNKADEGNSAANTSIARSKEQREAETDKRENSPSAALLKARSQVDQQHDQALNNLEYGDPKGASPEEQAGFKAAYKQLQTSKVDPVTREPWKAGEREAAAKAMLDEHENHKQGIEASRQQQLARLETPPAQNQGSRQQAAPPQQQAAPQQATPPAQGGAKPLDANTARQFLSQAGGDKAKARQLAASAGYKF